MLAKFTIDLIRRTSFRINLVFENHTCISAWDILAQKASITNTT